MSSQADYKAFVSSTYVDLKDHRAHVIRALRKAGFFVDPMEDWTASADEPKEFSRQRMEGCHLCILLIARRRGHVPSGDTSSITQQEYEEAKRLGIDILPYVLDDSVSEGDWRPWEEKERVDAWRAEVFEHHGVGSFKKTPKSLNIAAALTRWVTEQGPKTALRLYLDAAKQEHGHIRFVSLPRLEDNADAPIQRLYVEPAVTERAVSPDVDPGEWPETTPILGALAEHKKLVLLGDPGSGKSTLTSWLSWQLAEHHETGNEWTERLGNLIPIPMILRDLGIGAGITWNGLLEKFAKTPLGRLLTLENLKRLVRDGKAMIILDGLDEIGSPQVRREIRDAFWHAQSAFDCRWLLTSRIVGYSEVPFDWRSIGAYATRGYTQREATLLYATPFDNPRVDRFAHNWFVLREQTDHKVRTQSKELLEAIRSDEATTKLGRIPNLLTMMALIFRVRARLPHGRALLYTEIAQAYLETIDGWRRILARPETLPERRRWLARIGFEMQRKRIRQRMTPAETELDTLLSGDDQPKEILATGDEVRQWVAAAMVDGGRDGSEEDAADFVDYLAKRSGLLLPRGQDQFAFLHLSFQEYFAAAFLQNQIASPAWLMGGDVAQGAAKDDLLGYGGETVWRETLVFLVELVAASDQPMWLEPILTALFGKNFENLGEGIREGEAPAEPQARFEPLAQTGSAGASPSRMHAASQSQALLLARLAIDPHAGFSTDARRTAIDVCCCREVRLMISAESWTHSNEVLGVLFGTESEVRRTLVPVLANHIRQQNGTGLNLRDTGVSDVSGLAGLSSLRYLNLQGTGVSDVSGLASLTSLQSLTLNGTGVSDVSGLSGLTALENLDLCHIGVSDVSCLSGLTSLQMLGLNGTGVSDVSGLSGLTSLLYLNLQGTGVSDVRGLSGLTSLLGLFLQGTGVSDVSGLSGLTSLKTLDLQGTGVSDEQVNAFHQAREKAGLTACKVVR